MEYIISGNVVKGDQYGRTLGFPTANLDKEAFARIQQQPPKEGIYAGYTQYNNQKIPSAVIIHTRKDDAFPTIETHLLDTEIDLYHQNIDLMLVAYIRPYISFQKTDRLIEQIEEDIAKIRKILQE